MNSNDGINEVLATIGPSLPEGDKDLLTDQLSVYINDLLINDFNQLVYILYRVDISENKLKQTLIENKEKEAGKLIAGMLIERQLEKMKSRKAHPFDREIPDDEKW